MSAGGIVELRRPDAKVGLGKQDALFDKSEHQRRRGPAEARQQLVERRLRAPAMKLHAMEPASVVEQVTAHEPVLRPGFARDDKETVGFNVDSRQRLQSGDDLLEADRQERVTREWLASGAAERREIHSVQVDCGPLFNASRLPEDADMEAVVHGSR
jgi:hypothetical protein